MLPTYMQIYTVQDNQTLCKITSNKHLHNVQILKASLLITPKRYTDTEANYTQEVH